MRGFRLRALLLCLSAILAAAAGSAGAGVVRVPFDNHATTALQNGRLLFLECRPPRGDSAAFFFERYLADPRLWTAYRNRQAVAVPFDQLKPEVRRHMLLTVFHHDYVDEQGWWHTAIYSEGSNQETLWSLCEWTTGSGHNYVHILESQSHLEGPALRQGQRVLIPAHMLCGVMRQPAAARVAAPAAVPEISGPPPEPSAPDAPAAFEDTPEPGQPSPVALSVDSDYLTPLELPELTPLEANGHDNQPLDLEALTRELVYGQDERGPYAVYRLQPGESLYTAVVVRFTDFRGTEVILDACNAIQERSGIRDVRNMPAGQRILIPMDMLSDRFRPHGSEQRAEYEKSIQEARRLRGQQVRTADLEGVVVVLDPGHGGRDHGAVNYKFGLYEDELNYDVACRIKKILETQTHARVYMTVLDPVQQYEPTNRRRFNHDTGEILLTTPPYENMESGISATLRCYLANSWYRQEVRNGADPRKMVFTSIHTDALYNHRLRGAMIYIPGARYRRDSETPRSAGYTKFAQYQEQPTFRSTAAERRRDEALSRNFAEDVMEALGRRRIRRHLEGDWIRAQIRQDGGRVYVPAVLRNNEIPTKILIEMANINNETDCERLADPQWRQTFAEAYVDALRTYFGPQR